MTVQRSRGGEAPCTQVGDRFHDTVDAFNEVGRRSPGNRHCARVSHPHHERLPTKPGRRSPGNADRLAPPRKRPAFQRSPGNPLRARDTDAPSACLPTKPGPRSPGNHLNDWLDACALSSVPTKPGKHGCRLPADRAVRRFPTKPGRRSPGNRCRGRSGRWRRCTLPTKPGPRSPGNASSSSSTSFPVPASNEARAAKPGKPSMRNVLSTRRR